MAFDWPPGVFDVSTKAKFANSPWEKQLSVQYNQSPSFKYQHTAPATVCLQSHERRGGGFPTLYNLVRILQSVVVLVAAWLACRGAAWRGLVESCLILGGRFSVLTVPMRSSLEVGCLLCTGRTVVICCNCVPHPHKNRPALCSIQVLTCCTVCTAAAWRH